MKKKLITIFLFVGFMNMIFAHGEGVHQHMVREAYKLLKTFIGQDIREMKDHVGYNEVGYGAFNPGNLIVIGAHREDAEDVVYGFSGLNTTNTHFWDPDEGDGSHFISPTGGSYHNAYEKALLFINSGYDLNIELILYGFPTEANGSGFCATQRAILTFHYNSLMDMYKNKNIYVTKVSWQTGGQTIYNNPIKFLQNHWSLLNSGTYNGFFGLVSFEILGRVCHLLGDMTVPAHTHNDPHPAPVNPDSYEEWMNQPSIYNQWTYLNAVTQGGLINSTLNSNPLKYLFYPTAQIASFFGSSDIDGNNGSGINDPFSFYAGLPEMIQQLNSTFGGPTPHTFIPLTDISNYSFVYGIRAIAGLLYWFAKEADLLPIPLTSVYLSGTYDLYLNQTGYWYTQLGNGLEPFTYNWEIMYLTGGTYLSSSLKVPIGPRLPEPGYWLHVGTNSSTFSRLNNGADLRNFKLRCTVTDGSNTTKVSNEWTVSVYSTSPPQGSIVSNDGNNAVMMKENEVEVRSVPKEFSLDQNYPNPFNPATRISYSLPDANFVTLKIYDMLGSEVVTLVNENKTAGKFEVEFDASKLSSGTYVYKLVAGNYQITKKMQFVK